MKSEEWSLARPYVWVVLHSCTQTLTLHRQLQHSLRSASLELSLARSKHSVEVVVKDEDIRKLRVSQCLLESDNSDLHEQLEEEQARSDELESALDDALLNLDEQKAEGEAAQNQLRTQSREIANLKVGAPASTTS